MICSNNCVLPIDANLPLATWGWRAAVQSPELGDAQWLDNALTSTIDNPCRDGWEQGSRSQIVCMAPLGPDKMHLKVNVVIEQTVQLSDLLKANNQSLKVAGLN